MKRLMTILGLGVSIAALSAGTASAARPPTPVEDDPRFPTSEGYYWIADEFPLPAGTACSGEVRMTFLGHGRDFINGEITPPEEFPDPVVGMRHVAESPDLVVTVTNVATNRSVTKLVDGVFRDRVVDFGKDGVLDLRSKGIGNNVFFGAGVKGIIYASGKQKFTVDDFLGESVLHLNKTQGKTVELCRKIGLGAVPGSNPEPPPEEVPPVT
jgi:hypothetical protein